MTFIINMEYSWLTLMIHTGSLIVHWWSTRWRHKKANSRTFTRYWCVFYILFYFTADLEQVFHNVLEKNSFNIHYRNLNMLFWAYSLIMKRLTRSAIIVEINTKDVKLLKTNISSLYSKRHLQRISLFT